MSYRTARACSLGRSVSGWGSHAASSVPPCPARARIRLAFGVRVCDGACCFMAFSRNFVTVAVRPCRTVFGPLFSRSSTGESRPPWEWGRSGVQPCPGGLAFWHNWIWTTIPPPPTTATLASTSAGGEATIRPVAHAPTPDARLTKTKGTEARPSLQAARAVAGAHFSGDRRVLPGSGGDHASNRYREWFEDDRRRLRNGE